MRINKILLASFGIVFILALLIPKVLSATEINLSFDRYYNHAELTKILKTLASLSSVYDCKIAW